MKTKTEVSMGQARIIYREWIVQAGRDTRRTGEPAREWSRDYNYDLVAAVTAALDGLDAAEAEFIRLFYFEGLGYRHIGRRTGRRLHRLEALHRRALRKLRRRLPQLLPDRAGIEAPPESACPLCRHPRRPEIDRLIAAKSKRETWRPTLRRLRTEYGLSVGTRRLMSHAAYHITERGESE